jgi:arsenate reductase (glutaredoxin)
MVFSAERSGTPARFTRPAYPGREGLRLRWASAGEIRASEAALAAASCDGLRSLPFVAIPDVYFYAKCSTCRKALKWLEQRGVKYHLHDIVTEPPSAIELRRVLTLAEVPVKKLFNTSGASYRDGGYGERLRTMSDPQALEALACDGKLIKRPLMIGPDWALVGFDEAAYRARFRA